MTSAKGSTRFKKVDKGVAIEVNPFGGTLHAYDKMPNMRGALRGARSQRQSMSIIVNAFGRARTTWQSNAVVAVNVLLQYKCRTEVNSNDCKVK